MREILFRGKRMDNGEWVFGDLIREPWGYCIQVVTGSGNEYSRKKYAITEETVGQYTGLKDKNGNRIWVGDIVQYQFDNDDCPFPNKRTDKIIGKIFFSEFRASFSVTAGRNGSDMVNDDLFKYVQNGNRVEVIGNITDNPELL